VIDSTFEPSEIHKPSQGLPLYPEVAR